MKVFAPGNVFAATAVGFSAIIFVAVARRIELGAWISVLLFAAFSGVAATLIVPRFEARTLRGDREICNVSYCGVPSQWRSALVPICRGWGMA